MFGIFARMLLLRSGILKWTSFHVLQFDCEKGTANASYSPVGCLSGRQSICIDSASGQLGGKSEQPHCKGEYHPH